MIVQKLAIVIGIDLYGPGIAQLETAVADARKFAELLKMEHRYESTRLLIDKEASREKIIGLLEKWLPHEVSEESAVVLYFAGHGIARGDGREGPRGYLIPQDATLVDESTWIDMALVQRALATLKCRHLLVVLDCCFAGSFRWASGRSIVPLDRPLFESQYKRFLKGKAWQVLTSSSHDEEALDVTPGSSNTRDADVGLAHSPFAAALIRGLQGEADSSRGGHLPDGVITATELYQYIFEELVPPGGDAFQTPGIWPLAPGNKGEFIFLHPKRGKTTVPDPPLNEKNNPWLGLRTYKETDAALLFGRENVIRELLAKVLDENGPRLIGIVGASGTGKSSVVKAGLVPRLLQISDNESGQTENWAVISCARLGQQPSIQLLAAEQVLAQACEPNQLLIIDQFEELFTHCTSAELRDGFLQAIVQMLLARPGLKVLTTLRSDFEPRISESEEFSILWRIGRYVLPILTTDHLIEVVEGPAQAKGLYFDPDSLVRKLVNEVVAMPGALPLLSFTLSEMYRRAQIRREDQGALDRALTEEDHDATGGVVGALHRRATAIYEQLDKPSQETARRLFLRMVSQEGGQLTRRRVKRAEFDFPDAEEQDRVESVLNAYDQARLIVRDKGHIEPAHDTLVLAWEKLQNWLATYGPQVLLRQVWRAASHWNDTYLRFRSKQRGRWGRSRHSRALKGLLWNQDPRLSTVEAFYVGNKNQKADLPGELNSLETNFITESLKRRRNRKNFILTTTIGTMLTLTVLSAGFNLQMKAAKDNAEYAAAQSERAARIGLNLGLTRINDVIFEDSNRALEMFREYKFPEEYQGFAWRYLYPFANRLMHILNDHHGPVSAIAFSPNGRFFASGGAYGRIVLRDAISGTPLDTIFSHWGWVLSITFSPDGKMLASSGEDGFLHVWNTEDNKVIGEFEISDVEVRSVAFTLDGDELLAADADGKIMRWVVNTMGPVETFAQYPNNVGVNALAVAKNFSMLAAAGDDGRIRIWDEHTGWRSSPKGFDSGPIFAVAFSPDGTKLAFGGADSNVTLWDVINDKQIYSVRHENDGPVRSVTFLADGALLASGNDGGAVTLWATASGSHLAKLTGHKLRVWSVAATPDGSMLASGSDDGTVRLWNTEPERDATKVLSFNEAQVLSLDISPDGRSLATSDADTWILLWDIVTEQPHVSFHATASRVYSVAFSPNGKSVAWGGEDSTVTVANIETRETDHTLSGGKGWVYDIAYSRDGKLATANQGNPDSFPNPFPGYGGVSLWSGMEQTNFDPMIPARSVAFSPDGKLLAAGYDDGNIQIWNLPDPQPMAILEKNHSARVNSLAFSPDGKTLASASLDKTVGLWRINASSGASSLVRKLTEHSADVTAVAFTLDGKTLASGSSDHSVRLWDPQTGAARIMLDGKIGSVRAIAFSPDSNTLAAGGEDGSIRLWHAPEVIKKTADNVDSYDWNDSGPIPVPDTLDLNVDKSMIKIPGGCYVMGGEGLNEDLHEVCVDSFAIGKYPVTVGEFRAFSEVEGRDFSSAIDDIQWPTPTSECSYRQGTGWKPERANWRYSGLDQDDNHPVVCVDLYTVMAYIDFLNNDRTSMRPFRLPTEAEWEYAARGSFETGNGFRYWWGNDIGSNRANCVGCGNDWDVQGTSPVGTFEPNDFGLYDVLGNVLEWTCSAYGRYDSVRERECAFRDDVQRVSRGGAWYLGEKDIRTASRHGRIFPGERTNTVGFRLVQDL